LEEEAPPPSFAAGAGSSSGNLLSNSSSNKQHYSTSIIMAAITGNQQRRLLQEAHRSNHHQSAGLTYISNVDLLARTRKASPPTGHCAPNAAPPAVSSSSRHVPTSYSGGQEDLTMASSLLALSGGALPKTAETVEDMFYPAAQLLLQQQRFQSQQRHQQLTALLRLTHRLPRSDVQSLHGSNFLGRAATDQLLQTNTSCLRTSGETRFPPSTLTPEQHVGKVNATMVVSSSSSSSSTDEESDISSDNQGTSAALQQQNRRNPSSCLQHRPGNGVISKMIAAHQQHSGSNGTGLSFNNTKDTALITDEARTVAALETFALSCVERRINKAPYLDASIFDDPHPMVLGACRRSRGGTVEPFPEKLNRILVKAEKAGNQDIVSFLPHGRAFVIHKPKKFAEKVMPKYFKHSKLSSFQRQLGLYGFCRINGGPDAGGYYHELFLQGRPALGVYISRVGVPNAAMPRRRGVKAHNSIVDPDFHAIRPIRNGMKQAERGREIQHQSLNK
jgi:hypothetical protein